MTDGGVSSDDKMWSGLGYVGSMCLGIPALILYFVKPDVSPFVKFHFLQSFAYGAITGVLLSIIGFASSIPVAGFFAGILLLVIWPITAICWIVLIVFGFMGKDFRIPGLAGLLEPYVK